MFDFYDLYFRVYVSPLSKIRWWILILVLSWGILLLAFSRRHWLWHLWRSINCILCIISLVVIIRTTLFRNAYEDRVIYLIPFYSLYLARLQPEKYREMLMNVFMFLPVGLTIPYAVDLITDRFYKKRELLSDFGFRNRFRIIGYSIFLAAAFSFGIELLQAIFALGTAEVDDVIMNTLGAAIGCCPFLVRLSGVKHY